jgi:hypothetical protein
LVPRNLLLTIGVLLAALTLALTGCGGGGGNDNNASETTETTTIETTTDATGTTGASSRADDCANLIDVVTDFQQGLAIGVGIDYERDRDFLADYSDRAPAAIAADIRTLSTFMDAYTSAAQEVGLRSGLGPTPDEASHVEKKMALTAAEKAAKDKALAAVDTWRTAECAGF